MPLFDGRYPDDSYSALNSEDYRVSSNPIFTESAADSFAYSLIKLPVRAIVVDYRSGDFSPLMGYPSQQSSTKAASDPAKTLTADFILRRSSLEFPRTIPNLMSIDCLVKAAAA